MKYDVIIPKRIHKINAIIDGLAQNIFIKCKTYMSMLCKIAGIKSYKKITNQVYLFGSELNIKIDTVGLKKYLRYNEKLILTSFVNLVYKAVVGLKGSRFFINVGMRTSVVELRLLGDMYTNQLGDFDNMSLSSTYYKSVEQ